MLTPMLQPFHFAFFVRDLDATRRFYGEALGCAEGRSTDAWVDFDAIVLDPDNHSRVAIPP